jgi:hypothetical protein
MPTVDWNLGLTIAVGILLARLISFIVAMIAAAINNRRPAA